MDQPAALPQAPLALADLIVALPLVEGQLSFLQQTGSHPVAGVQVLEGDIKAEGDFTFQMVDLPARTLACWVPISRQAASDLSGLQLLVDNELTYAVQQLEEAQILNGTGANGQLTGLMPAAHVVAVTATTPIDAVGELVASLSASGTPVSGVVLNPVDYLTMTQAKAVSSGTYLLGSPLQPPGKSLWGVSLALSSQLAQGSALAGDFTRGCTLRYRELLTIELSSEHSDFFIRNLLCARAEERVLLAIRQPLAFGTCTLPAVVPGTATAKK